MENLECKDAESVVAVDYRNMTLGVCGKVLLEGEQDFDYRNKRISERFCKSRKSTICNSETN